MSDDMALLESVAEPWICVEERACEETVAVHWEELLTAISGALTTARREARAEAFKDVLAIADEHLNSPGFGWLLRDKLRTLALEAAATTKKEANGEI